MATSATALMRRPARCWYVHRPAGPVRRPASSPVALILVFWGQPTGLTVLVLAIVLLVLLGFIELIGRRPAQPEIAGHVGGRR